MPELEIKDINSVLTQKKIAYFGGTFDPVHRGHVAVAADALQIVGLDEVCFLPAQHNPHKENAPLADFEQRLQMIRLAIQGEAGLSCSPLEAELPQPSYTYRVVCRLAEMHPNDEIYWILGADQIPNLHRWYEIDKLCGMLCFLFLERPGYELDTAPLEKIDGIRYKRISNMHQDVSATEVRRMLEENKCPQDLLSEKVLAYIRKNNLYSPSFTNH